MVDFAQTMKDWHRLCQAMTVKNPKDACNGCPLEAYGCSPVYEALDIYRDVDFEVVGETIMSWAAEHPEPVYPTWGEWLMSIGVISGLFPKGAIDALGNLKQPIPADIAEKLGLRPKEM